jgi:hypothetical protein
MYNISNNRLTLVGPKGWAMVLGLRRRSAQDGDNTQEEDHVPYKLASYEHDSEGKRFKSSDVVYSFWSAAKYTLVLSIILWWLPLFGQMIAGYVGGRRAGSPWKGVAAAIIPVVCLYIVVTGFDSGFFPSHLMGVAIAPAAVAASVGESIPFISPYIHFSSEYVGSFVDALAGSSPYGINTYVVTVAFAYVGGILAEQSRREIEYTSGSVMSNTTVLMPNEQRGFHPYPAPSRPGLAHMIASHMPWSHEHAAAYSHQHVHSLPPARTGGWEYASGAALADHASQRQDDVASVDGRPVRRRRVARASGSDPKSRHRNDKDPWQRAHRRVKQPYSAARRFVPQCDEPAAQRPARGRSTQSYPGRSRGSPRFVPADAKSVKRARKKIDREWNSHQRVDRVRQRPVVEFSDDDDMTEDAATRAHSSARRSRPPKSDRWNSI